MSMRLLLVDDEASVLRVLKATLEPLKYHVVALTDSGQAAEALERQKFDGIILDVLMPAPDGLELTRRARRSELNKTAAIVLLTGMDDAQTMREGFKAGATCFLSKPITRDRLANLVNILRGSVQGQRMRHARVTFRGTVDCRWGEKKERHFIAESLQISEHGMVIEPAGGVEVGQEIHLEFRLPSLDKPLRVRTKAILREPPNRMAVEFLDCSVKDREAIHNYVVERLES